MGVGPCACLYWSSLSCVNDTSNALTKEVEAVYTAFTGCGGVRGGVRFDGMARVGIFLAHIFIFTTTTHIFGIATMVSICFAVLEAAAILIAILEAAAIIKYCS